MKESWRVMAAVMQGERHALRFGWQGCKRNRIGAVGRQDRGGVRIVRWRRPINAVAERGTFYQPKKDEADDEKR